MYTADGFISVNIMPKGRHWLADQATLEQLRETVGNGTAYAGRYELNSKTHTITHISQVSMEPYYQDKHLVRSYAIEGDTLTLSGTFLYQGETVKFVIRWTRVVPAA